MLIDPPRGYAIITAAAVGGCSSSSSHSVNSFSKEHQEAVIHLLHQTKEEMHAAMQPDCRSPKPMNTASSASPLKVGSDSVQNSITHVPSQVKGKKRERVDHGSEDGKRERTIKTDDMDSVPCRQGSVLKVEVEKITDKGGLIDSEGVEKLVQLMVLDKSEKKLDLAGQAILAGVIEATDKYDCLSQFVQLKGLIVFDKWLQEVHRRKFGDLSGPKDSDKSVEEFLLVLLGALDKLPVNLQALKICNIGKSVNRLRSHKNLEIQKKARGLVDAWKKRVEAEMNITDAKSGLNQSVSWPVRPQILEVSQGGNRQSGGTSEVAVKSSAPQLSASKFCSSKTVQGEITSRQISAPNASASSPSTSKLLLPPASADTNAKEWQLHSTHVAGASDLPLESARDEKISGSTQSYSPSQSFSGEQTKSGGIPGKDDLRSSASASTTSNKASAGSLRHPKSSNGLPVLISSGEHVETGAASNSSVNKKTASDNLSKSGVVYEKATGGTTVEGNNDKLIVNVPNQGRYLAQHASGSCPDDHSLIKRRVSSPVHAERPNLSDQSLKGNRSVLIEASEVGRSTAVVSDDSKQIAAVENVTLSSSVNENNTLNLQDASFSSMNALIESCVKYSEANATLSAVDDAGMNLLASVAAGEFSKSRLTTPIRSPQSSSIVIEESSVGGNTEAKYQNECSQDHNHCGDTDANKCSRSPVLCQDLGATNVDGNSANLMSVEKSDGERDNHCSNTSQGVQEMKESCLVGEERVSEKAPDASFQVFPGGTMDEDISRGCGEQLCEANIVGKIEEGFNDDRSVIGCSTVGVEMGPTLNTKMDVDVEEKKCSFDRLNIDSQKNVKSPSEFQLQSALGGDEQVSCNSCHGTVKMRDEVEMKLEKSEHSNTKTSVAMPEIQKPEQEENTMVGTRVSEITSQDAEYIEDNLANKETASRRDGQILHTVSPSNQSKEAGQVYSSESKLTATKAEEAEECSSTTADASSRSAAAFSGGDSKVEFDLNEGLVADDGKCLDMNSASTPGCSNPVQLISPVPFASSGNSVSMSITVAAAAKRPFLPPEDLLKNKVELGWKGSAATSAFRPAEPRKVMELSSHPSSLPLSDTRAGKQSRPLLDIDLNVADERILEDVSHQFLTREDDCVPFTKDVQEPTDDKVLTSGLGWCSGRIELDLNQVDATPDLGNCLAGNSARIDEKVMLSKPSCCGPSNSGLNVHRDFDLNDGPGIDEVNIDTLIYNQQTKISVPSQPSIPGFKMSNPDIGNLSTWFPSTGNTYSAVALSSIMSDRDQPFAVGGACGPQRVSGTSCGSPFRADVYRGPILSSSPAVPFPSGAFQYPVFQVGPSFPLPSTSLLGASANYVDPSSGGRLSFPTANPQLFGAATTVSSHYPRPFVVCIPEGSNNGSESSRKCGKQGLDLNTGPGGADGDGRDDSMLPTLRHLSVGSSQALAEEHARMFQMPGSMLKRKEPEGGWDGFKQSSWQ